MDLVRIWQAISFEATDHLHLDSLQDQRQLSWGNRSLVGLEVEASRLQSLVPDGVSGVVPPQGFDLISALVEEDEDLSGGGILGQELAYQAGKAIEGLALVGGLAAKEDPQIRRAQHGVASSHSRMISTNPGEPENGLGTRRSR